jgi:hypothetical protein
MMELFTSLYVRSKISNVSMSLSEPGFCSLQVGLLDQVCCLQSGVGIRRKHGCFVVHDGFHVFIFGIVLEILELQPVHERLQTMLSVIEPVGEGDKPCSP